MSREQARVRAPPVQRSRSRRIAARLGIGCVSGLFLLGLAEVAARVLVRRMDAEKLRIYTEHTDVKGRYRSHPRLPYVPTPGYPSHNSLGFRGPEVELEKPPGRLRIACLGASTTYGHELAWNDAWPAQLERLLRAEGVDAEVINGGVPGWISLEMRVSLEVSVLPLRPDVVVVYEGRNELFPQSFRDYRSDYSHYRDPHWDFAGTNYVHKEVFRWSRLALLLCTHAGQRFGWEERLENPIYGCNVKANVPTPEEIVRHLADPERTEGYRDNLEQIVALSRAGGARVLLCTMAFRAEKFASGNLPEDPSAYPALGLQVEENNGVVRDMGRRLGVPVAETASLAAHEEWFRDDCHTTPEAQARQAEIVLERLIAEDMLRPGG